MLQPSSGRHAASPVHVADDHAVAELVVAGIDDGLVENDLQFAVDMHVSDNKQTGISKQH